MGTKEQLLRLLEDNRERHVSGAAMAKAIGVSRNAVWKAVEALRAEGYAVYAVEQVEGAVMLDAFRAAPGVKYALVFGNEVDGVGQEAVDRCDGAVEIPQAGTKHSVNVSVSGGVVLWSFFCQIRPKR